MLNYPTDENVTVPLDRGPWVGVCFGIDGIDFVPHLGEVQRPLL